MLYSNMNDLLIGKYIELNEKQSNINITILDLISLIEQFSLNSKLISKACSYILSY